LGNGTTSGETTPANVACSTSVLGISDFEVTNANEVKFYPNPVADILNIAFDHEIKNVSIYNLLGQEMMTKTINANEGSVDVSHLSKGTYLVKVNVGEETKTLKVIKR